MWNAFPRLAERLGSPVAAAGHPSSGVCLAVQFLHHLHLTVDTARATQVTTQACSLHGVEFIFDVKRGLTAFTTNIIVRIFFTFLTRFTKGDQILKQRLWLCNNNF
jgi:hypothetical protein